MERKSANSGAGGEGHHAEAAPQDERAHKLRGRIGIGLFVAAIAVLACTTVQQPLSANPYVAEQQKQQPQNQGAATATGANVTIAAAGGVAAHRRNKGECYTPCGPGTACNEQTGMCETLPCRGVCRPDQRCDNTGGIGKCVDNARIIPNPQNVGGSGNGGSAKQCE